VEQPRRGRGRPPGGEATTRATKDSIVAAAFRVFSESGYVNASLREIARQCGVSHATLLHHFPHKSELLAATLARRDAEFPDDFGGQSIDDVLLDMVEGARRNESRLGLVRMYTLLSAEAGDPTHPAHPYFERRTREFTALVAGILRRGQEDGTVSRDHTPEQLAVNVMALWDGLQVLAAISVDPVCVADQLQVAFEQLLRRPLRRQPSA